ncbi:MAG: MCP four helix bundle domain-containing protein [Deltaproteobacteria bacterium]|nr:MCP four helix bundle domain-containing protein [Deltaproteobacteria bacterium]
MQLSIQRRIQMSYFIAILLVALIGLFSFYYLHRIHKSLESIFSNDLERAQTGEELQTQYQQLDRYTQAFLAHPEDVAEQERWKNALDQLIQEIQKGKSVSLASSQQNLQKLQLQTQRNMGLVLFLTFFGGIFIAFYFPSRVVLPMRRFVSTLREVQDCNFEASLNMKGGDELAQVGHEIDRLISRIREFDDMKVKKIAFERRRFDTLANMVDIGVVVVNIENQIVYMNSQLFTVLGLESEEVIGNEVDSAPLPDELKDLLRESLDKKEKFDNHEITMSIRNKEEKVTPVTVNVDLGMVRNHAGDVVNLIVTLEEKQTSWAEKLFQRI